MGCSQSNAAWRKRLLGERPDDFGGDVEEEDGGDEGQGEHEYDEGIAVDAR